MEEKGNLHYLQSISKPSQPVNSAFTTVISIRTPADAKAKAFSWRNGHVLSVCDVLFCSYRRSSARRFKEAWDGIEMRMILKSEENERTVKKESEVSEREEKRVTGEMDLEQIPKKWEPAEAQNTVG